MLQGLISFLCQLLVVCDWVVVITGNVYFELPFALSQLVFRLDQSLLVGCFQVDCVVHELVLKTDCGDNLAAQD